MNKLIIKLFKQIIDDLDSGASYMDEDESAEVLDLLKKYTRKDTPMSKYQAYTSLGISRATFDNLVKEGRLPKGKKVAGFKELQWFKKDLDNYTRKKAL